jgi:pyrophosphatase PpaX
MIKGIIFDMDGTLIDTNALVIECIQEAVKEFLGYHPSVEEFVEIIGKPLSVQMGFFSGEKTIEMVEYYRKIYHERRDKKTYLFSGVAELLEKLDEIGMLMAIVSNKGSHGIHHALEKFNLEKYFDPVISVTDVIHKKPDPEGAYKTLQKWGFKSEETLFIGDSSNDVLCANQAGIPAVLVGWTILPEHQFTNLKIDYRVEHIEEIFELIRSHKRR